MISLIKKKKGDIWKRGNSPRQCKTQCQVNIQLLSFVFLFHWSGSLLHSLLSFLRINSILLPDFQVSPRTGVNQLAYLQCYKQPGPRKCMSCQSIQICFLTRLFTCNNMLFLSVQLNEFLTNVCILINIQNIFIPQEVISSPFPSITPHLEAFAVPISITVAQFYLQIFI